MHKDKYLGKQKLASLIIAMIALLWFYAAVSKLINFQHFRDAMQKQPFSPRFQTILIFGLPVVEVSIGSLLIIEKRRLAGLYISAVLFTAFIIYILLILARFFGHIPCACGGLIERMGWTFHLWFNAGFLLLTILSTILITKRKEGSDK